MCRLGGRNEQDRVRTLPEYVHDGVELGIGRGAGRQFQDDQVRALQPIWSAPGDLVRAQHLPVYHQAHDRRFTSADESVTSDARARSSNLTSTIQPVDWQIPTQHLKYTDNETHTSTHGRRRQGPVRVAVSDPRVVRSNG